MTFDELALSPDSHDDDFLPLVTFVAFVVLVVAFFLLCRIFWKRCYRDLFSLTLLEEENALPSCKNTLKRKRSRHVHNYSIQTAESEV
jgi:hypothetical protein